MNSYEALTANIGAIEKLGKWVALSGMFGCSTEAQGCVVAAHCFISGVPLLEYQRRNSMTMGRPSIPYDAMLAAFRERGGELKIMSRTADKAEIELSYKGDTQRFSLSWEDASKETFPYEGKEKEILAAMEAGKQPKLKAKYATPRSRAIMLYARVVSDGIRAMASDVNYGAYSPEEIEDFQEEVTPEQPRQATVAAPKPQEKKTIASLQVNAAETAATTLAVKQQEAEDDREKPFLPKSSSVNTQSLGPEAFATEEQVAEITELLKQEVANGNAKAMKDVSNKLYAQGIVEEKGKLRRLLVEEAEVMLSHLRAGKFLEWMANTGTVAFRVPF